MCCRRSPHGCTDVPSLIIMNEVNEEQAIEKLIADYLRRLGDGQYETLAADFAPNALIVVARERDGQWTNSYQSATEWLDGIKKNPIAAFREPVFNVQVTIDSNRIAYLRADFQVIRDGKVQSQGTEVFTLIREPSNWKIAAVTYTSQSVL